MSGQGYPLDDRTRNRIAILATDGHKNTVIARICGICDRTVERVRRDIQEQKTDSGQKKV